MKKLLLTAMMILLLGAATNSAQAVTLGSTTISTSLPSFSSPDNTPTNSYWIVGIFNYFIPEGQKIVKGRVYGQWGNTENETSADNKLFINTIFSKSSDGSIIYNNETNLLVDNTFLHNPEPYNTYNTPWEHIFTKEELSLFGSGEALFLSQMLSPPIEHYTGYDEEGYYYDNVAYYTHIRLGTTTLELETTPVPEPSSMILGIMGLGSMLGFRKRK